VKLLIISNMEHYYRDGQVVGHGATAREISYLASLFDEVRHVACLHREEPSAMFLPYESDKVTLVPLPPTGGKRFIDKLNILLHTPKYIYTILRELPKADVVHVRCPANIPLLAIILLAFVRYPRKRWIKYAGNWQPSGKEALSYTFQRWWLQRNFARAKVTVNGEWNDQPAHIHSFLNPCLTDEELQTGMQAAEQKSIGGAMQLVFVGRLETAKGVARILEIVKELNSAGLLVQVDLIGDGPERFDFEIWCRANQLEQVVHFHGWLARAALNKYYTTAHIILFPSTSSEGWPKVLSEAMAFGVVPVASDISSIPALLRRFETGKAFQAENLDAFVEAIQWYGNHGEHWKQESQKSVQAAHLFSYQHYLEAVSNLLELS